MSGRVAGEAEEGEVVCLGGAAGEDDLVGVGVEQGGGPFAGVLEGLTGASAGAVTTGGIASYLGEVRPHGLPDRRQDRGGGVVVEVQTVHGWKSAAGDGRQPLCGSRFLPSAFLHSTPGPTRGPPRGSSGGPPRSRQPPR